MLLENNNLAPWRNGIRGGFKILSTYVGIGSSPIGATSLKSNASSGKVFLGSTHKRHDAWACRGTIRFQTTMVVWCKWQPRLSQEQVP